MAIGQGTPKAVVAMGGRYAVKDNREIPDTCEVLWDFGGMMVFFCQYNATGVPPSLQATRRWRFAAPRARCS